MSLVLLCTFIFACYSKGKKVSLNLSLKCNNLLSPLRLLSLSADIIKPSFFHHFNCLFHHPINSQWIKSSKLWSGLCLPECTLMHLWCDCPSGVFGDTVHTQTHTHIQSKLQATFFQATGWWKLEERPIFHIWHKKAWRRKRSKQLPVVSHKQG